MKNAILIILTLFCSFSLVGQIETSYKAETFGSIASEEHTPFWTVNQNWGAVPLNSDNFYVRGGVFHKQTLNKDWSFEAGFDLIGGNDSSYGDVWVQQLYGRLNWKIWRLDIGSREDYISLLNPYLSSGDFIHSNNARPLPEVKISMPDFWLVPYSKGNFFLKGEVSIGKYLDSNWQEETASPYLQNYTKDILSHHKSIYFRFGDMQNKHKMQFTVGMTHSTQWGGTLYKYKKDINGVWGYEITKQPKGLDDFLRMFIAKEGSSSSSNADNLYVSGSQIGSYIFKYDYKLDNQDVLSAYIHHFFDDGSGMVFENYRDNMLGIEYRSNKKSILSGAVFEYIYTKQQTGPIHHNELMDEEHYHLKPKGNGNDNYYNNTDYVQGPSHFGKSMGTPLLLSPEYNKDGTLNFKSSRIIAFHLGAEGYLRPDLHYRVLLTTGQSWGRYYFPYTKVKNGFASLLEFKYDFPVSTGFQTKLSVGYDNGQFFGGDTFGASISLIKRGVLFKK